MWADRVTCECECEHDGPNCGLKSRARVGVAGNGSRLKKKREPFLQDGFGVWVSRGDDGGLNGLGFRGRVFACES